MDISTEQIITIADVLGIFGLVLWLFMSMLAQIGTH
jgi:hypothetical protein